MTKVNMESMELFMQSYDVLKQKYFWDMDAMSAKVIEQIVSLEKRNNKAGGTWNVEKAKEAYLTVRKVYDDDTTNHLGILQLAFEKFIGDFVGIEGVDQLFEASYFYFEWMMHLEYSQDRHDYINYRDHYIHQIKNMYEMLLLLDEYGYMEYCIKSYRNNSSLIANQIKSGIEEQLLREERQEIALFEQLTQYKVGNKSSHEEVKRRRQEYCYRYLIHAVSIVAALTHDIGYPVAYMLRTTKSLHSFLPISEAFLHLNDAMPHLEEILQSSLLYQTVEAKEIAKRIQHGRDHGAISAVILLSKYYETGAIYHLEPIEKMVIELSAVVVYNHTLKYSYMTGDEDQRYRNLFDENPISYLFRLCDDLQEWGRVYFDVSKKSNFLICPRCHMPINRDSIRNSKGRSHISYSCACGLSGVRRTQFPYRKLTNISACDALEIANLGRTTSDIDGMKISLKYNLVSLLQLSVYNPRFAKQRADSVYEIKRMLEGQTAIPNVYIDTFLTNNPIFIKVRCLEKYLQYMQRGKTSTSNNVWRKKDLITIKGDVKKCKRHAEYILHRMRDQLVRWDGKPFYPEADSVILHVCKEEKWDYYSDKTLWINIKAKWEENLQFYYFLSVIGMNLDRYRENAYLCEREEAIKLAKQLAEEVGQQYGISDNVTIDLVADYFWQRIRCVTEIEFFEHHNELRHYYEEQFLSNQAVIYLVEDYVESDAYNKVKRELQKEKPKDLKGIYDFYTDYELFSAMAQHSQVE